MTEKDLPWEKRQHGTGQTAWYSGEDTGLASKRFRFSFVFNVLLDKSLKLAGHCVFTCEVMIMMMMNTNTYQAFALHQGVFSVLRENELM